MSKIDSLLVDRELFHDTVNYSIDHFSKDYARLKCLEQEYKRLLQLIEILVEQGMSDHTITIKLTDLAVVQGKDWKGILETAISAGAKDE